MTGAAQVVAFAAERTHENRTRLRRKLVIPFTGAMAIPPGGVAFLIGMAVGGRGGRAPTAVVLVRLFRRWRLSRW